MPGGISGLSYPGRNKYRNMCLQAGGVSKIESAKHAQLKSADPTSHQRGRPTSLNLKKKLKKEGEKLVAGPSGCLLKSGCRSVGIVRSRTQATEFKKISQN
jgi:hypothetical protein